MNTLWINARFLDRPVTGVERVARELLTAIVAHHLDAEGRWTAPDGSLWQLRLLAPLGGSAPSPWRALPLLRAGRQRGHAWEQLDLPRLTRGDWLINLCNTAPLFKRRQIVFLHDAQPFAIPHNFTFAFRTWYRLLYSVAGRRAAVVLTNSEFSRDELVQRVGLDDDKIVVCLLGSEHAQRRTPDAAAIARFALPAEPFLLAVSSPSPNKNFAAVVRALELLGAAGPPCVIVGAASAAMFAFAAQLPATRERLA